MNARRSNAGIHQRTCGNCGVGFQAGTTRAQYCGRGCRRAAFLARTPFVIVGGEWRVCGCCGGEFLTFDRRRLYCNKTCKGRAHERQRTTRNLRRGVAVSVPCLHCGTAFETDDSRRRHCSGACCYQYRKARDAQREREKAAAIREATVPKPCGYCGGVIEGFRWRMVYCSDACKIHARNVRRQRQLAENPPPPVVQKPKVKAKPKAKPKPKPKPKPIPRPVVVEEVIPDYPIGVITGHGFSYSGYSESNPREAQTTVTGCPRCRASGKDYRGNIVHASWCGS